MSPYRFKLSDYYLVNVILKHSKNKDQALEELKKRTKWPESKIKEGIDKTVNAKYYKKLRGRKGSKDVFRNL